MEKYNFSIDLYFDWIEMLKDELKKWDYGKESVDSREELCHKYFNLMKRLIFPQEREVIKSDEFTYPQKPKYKKGVKLIENKIKCGKNIIPHLSSKIENFDYDDAMLNDWGVYHLHLGSKTISSGYFMERTGPLLFVYFTERKAYFIDIMEHGDWAKKEIIEIIHKNWPEIIKSHKLKGIEGMKYKPTEKNRKEFRNAGLSTFVELDDGTVYAPIGGGYSTTGLSIDVVRLCIMYKNKLEQHEDYFKNNLEEIVSTIKNHKGSLPDKLDFTLDIDREKEVFYVVETNSKIKFNIGNLEF